MLSPFKEYADPFFPAFLVLSSLPPPVPQVASSLSRPHEIGNLSYPSKRFLDGRCLFCMKQSQSKGRAKGEKMIPCHLRSRRSGSLLQIIEVDLVQPSIQAAVSQQVLVATDIENPSALHHDDPVGQR